MGHSTADLPVTPLGCTLSHSIVATSVAHLYTHRTMTCSQPKTPSQSSTDWRWAQQSGSSDSATEIGEACVQLLAPILPEVKKKSRRAHGLVVPVKRYSAYLDNQSTYDKHPTHGLTALKSRAMHNVQTPPPRPAPFKDTSTGSPAGVASHSKSLPFGTGRAYLL